MKTGLLNILIFTLLTAGLATSCMKDDVGSEPQGKDAMVTFSLNVPGARPVSTRSLTEAQENDVETVDVLVFGADGKFRFRQPGTNIQPNGAVNQKKFEVKLPVGTYDLMLIANGRLISGTDRVSLLTLAQGDTKAQVITKLENSLTAGTKWTSAAIPMWGQSNGVVISESTSGISTIKMTRMVAKIEVVLDAAAAGTGNDNFAITSVHLYNYNTVGKLVPELTSGWDDANNKALTPNLAATPGKTRGPLVYTPADDATGLSLFTASAMRNTIYTYEAAAGTPATSSQNTCIVVGGNYKNGGADKNFYRVDFVKVVGQTTTYLPLMRNFRYNVRITKITGPGYSTADEAFTAGPGNIEAEVVEWNESEYTGITYDNAYVLAVSKVQFELPRDEHNSQEDKNALSIFTDYPDGWKIESIKDNATDATADWLWVYEGASAVTQGAANVKGDVWLKTTENTSGAERTATVTVAAGKMRCAVTVKQSLVPGIGLSITNPTTKQPIGELIFAAAAGVAPATQQFKVSWAPKVADLTVSNTTMGAYSFGAAALDQTISGTIPGGTGSVTYNVQPTAITAAELASPNEFLERVTKVDYMVSNGITLEAKSLFLRQLVYNTIAKAEDYYMLDNTKTHSFSVRSNTQWKITNVSDPEAILDATYTPALLNQTGGYNTSATGQTINFKLVTDTDGHLSGKTVTLTLTDPTGHMTNVVVILKGLTCGTNGNAVTQTIGTKQYKTHQYGEKCWMVENLKEGSKALGTASAGYFGQGGTINGTNPGVGNGQYYYTYTQAATICPAGWHLPTYDEGQALVSTVISTPDGASSSKRWWAGSAGASNAAFAGHYFIANGTWYYWGSNGYWWCGTGVQYLYGSTSGMGSSTNTNGWFSVRCVQN